MAVIDDYCLADPVDIIEGCGHEHTECVFSFGYSKFLDFGCGGMIVSNESVPGTNRPPKLIDNYKSINNVRLLDDMYIGLADLSLSQFKASSFFTALKLIHSKRIMHQKSLSNIYSLIANTGRLCLNSPWRFIVKMSPDDESELSRLVSTSKEKLFYGKNSLLQIEGCTARVLTNLDKTASIPVNLFNDFRFDTKSATTLARYIQEL